MKNEVLVTTIVSVPEDDETTEDSPAIPSNAQVVIDIARAIHDARLTESEFVFKAAIQAVFGGVSFHW